MRKRLMLLLLILGLTVMSIATVVLMSNFTPSYRYGEPRQDALKVMQSLERDAWDTRQRLLFFYWQGE
jgi:hypothetical protein